MAQTWEVSSSCPVLQRRVARRLVRIVLVRHQPVQLGPGAAQRRGLAHRTGVTGRLVLSAGASVLACFGAAELCCVDEYTSRVRLSAVVG